MIPLIGIVAVALLIYYFCILMRGDENDGNLSAVVLLLTFGLLLAYDQEAKNASLKFVPNGRLSSNGTNSFAVCALPCSFGAVGLSIGFKGAATGAGTLIVAIFIVLIGI